MSKLTEPDGPDSLNARMSANPPGMPWLAGTGPNGETCRTCAHWRRTLRPTYDIPNKKKPKEEDCSFLLKPRPCFEFTRMMRANVREVIGAPVPAFASACRHFERYTETAAPLQYSEYAKLIAAQKEAERV